MFQSKTNKNQERILAMDYGLVRTGIAVSIDGVVSPVKTIISKDFKHFLAELWSEIVKQKVTKIVVGLPVSSDGKENDQTVIVRRIVNNLKKYIKLPFEFYNEYGTTVDYGVNSYFTVSEIRRRRKKIDQLSAQMILESYLIDKGIKK